MPKIVDPLALPSPREALQAAREADGAPSAAQVAGLAPTPAVAAPSVLPGGILAPSFRDKVKEDFRLFQIILWRHLLNNDPAPLLQDMAGFLQHGPDRSIIEAFRGAAKSWTTGAYGLWRLDRRPEDENILIVSGSSMRAVASTNWMLNLIMSWDFLKHLRPLPSQRQSAQQFDVGPAKASQSASVFSMGIGGQLVGFRASLIIPDDVETQTNSITAQMREKISEAVKEFDSVLKPDFMDKNGNRRTDIDQPAIKYLGTPHDTESLYNDLSNKRGYSVRVWPAEYPDDTKLKAYGDKLAPYIRRRMEELGPGCVGRPTMPERFSPENLAKRRLSLGPSEYDLQFMLDTSGSEKNKYPLRLRDFIVLGLDDRRGPEDVVWTDDAGKRLVDLPAMGRGQDYFYGPANTPGSFAPWTRKVAALDTSGRGADETSLSIVGMLNGLLGLLVNRGWLGAGYDIKTLTEVCALCVKHEVNTLYVEDNFGDGVVTALITPLMANAWAARNKAIRLGKIKGSEGGTEVIGVKVGNQMNKERRILSVLEPVLASHRLMVARKVIEDDAASIELIEGEDTRHRYSLFYQLTNLTKDKDSLHHDDRLDSLATAVGGFADILGVDPATVFKEASRTREEEWLDKLYGETEDDEYGVPKAKAQSPRAQSFRPQAR